MDSQECQRKRHREYADEAELYIKRHLPYTQRTSTLVPNYDSHGLIGSQPLPNSVISPADSGAELLARQKRGSSLVLLNDDVHTRKKLCGSAIFGHELVAENGLTSKDGLNDVAALSGTTCQELAIFKPPVLPLQFEAAKEQYDPGNIALMQRRILGLTPSNCMEYTVRDDESMDEEEMDMDVDVT